MKKHFDVIMVGAGHNGLVASVMLARSGRSVLILERRNVLGGGAATEEIFPGYFIDSGDTDAGMLHPEIVKQFDLKNFGLKWLEPPVLATSLLSHDASFSLWRDPQKTLGEIARFSVRDAEKYGAFCQFVGRSTRILKETMLLTPPQILNAPAGERFAWMNVALKIRGLGKRDMMDFLRLLPMSVKECLDEWFEGDVLKGLLGAGGIVGGMQGPYASGTAFKFLYRQIHPNSGFIQGGIGKISNHLAEQTKNYGAEIRMNQRVKSILIEQGKAIGIRCENGEDLYAKCVVSNLDPDQTFLGLVGAPNLPPNFVQRVRNIRYRGVTARMHLALDSLPNFRGLTTSQLSGHIRLSPSLEYLEHAYDDAKYGRFSTHPYLDIVIPTILDPARAPKNHHIISIEMQYAPYRLKSGTWDNERDTLGNHILNALLPYAPDLKERILHQKVITPLDLEREYGLTQGCIDHGQMDLDQLLLMRPVPGFARYHTPIENLYLCGAGTHPGGGFTGAPGYNAAREILKTFSS